MFHFKSIKRENRKGKNGQRNIEIQAPIKQVWEHFDNAHKQKIMPQVVWNL